MILSLTTALWLGTVSARAQPAIFTFGDRGAPRVEVTVTGKDNAPIPDATVKLTSSIGSFAAVKALGGGRYVAQYVVPQRRFPQLAIVSVEVTYPGGREHAWLTLPLQARADLRIETEPGARVTVDVGDRSFGPVRADKAGRATVPAVIAPCVASARIHATDPAGNASEKPLDLRPEPFPHAFAFVGAERVSWSDGQSTPVEVFAIDAGCTPVKSADGVTLRASAGTVGAPSTQGPGVLVFPFRAPDAVDPGFATLSVELGGSAASPESRVRLAPGPQTGFAIRFQPERFVAGSGRSVEIRTSPADAKGNPVPDGRPAERASADFGDLGGAPPAWTLAVPDRFEGRVASLVRVEGTAGRSEARLSLQTGPPQALEWTSRPRFLHAGEMFTGELRVTDAFGNGVSAAPVRASLEDGAPARVEALGDGRYRVTHEIPEDAPVRGHALTAEAGGSARAEPVNLDVGQYRRSWAFLLGASVTVQSNFVKGLALVPRLELGVRIARTNFDLLADAEVGLYRRFTTPLAAGQLSTSVTSYAVAIGARYSLPLSARWSLFVSAVVGAQIARSRLALQTVDATRTQVESSPTLLLRGAFGGAVAVGRGRFFAQVEGSRAPARGQLSGNLGGMGVGVGYLHAF